MPPTPKNPHIGGTQQITLAAKDCTFDLDDTERVVKQDEDGINKAIQSTNPVSYLITFQFQRVRLIYKGGTLPSVVNLYIFQDCTFDWELPTVPSASGQKITQQILEAENPSDVVVSIT